MTRVAAAFAGLAIIAAACGGGKDEGIAKGTSATSAATNQAVALATGISATSQTSRTPGPTATPAPSPTPSPTPTATPERPAPVLEVAYFYSDTTTKLMRFLGLVRNPSTKTIEGLRIRWDAYSDDSALVGSFTANMPAIAGGQTFNYVGGAGVQLSGRPSSVKLTVVDGGKLTDNSLAFFTVEPLAIEAAPYTTNEYIATANVTTGDKAVNQVDMIVNVVLRDQDDKVVGINFASSLTLPDVVPPNTKVRVRIPLIQTTGKPVKAEWVGYAAVR